MTPAYIVFIKKPGINANQADRDGAQGAQRFEGDQLRVGATYAWQEVREAASAEGTVVLKFPDWDSALRWYHGRTGQEAAPHGLAEALYQAILVEGTLAEPAPA